MDSKTAQNVYRKTSDNCRNILISLMAEMNVNSKFQNEILYFADNKKTLPYIPKTAIKSKKETPALVKSLPKLPTKPLQRMKSKIVESGSYEVEAYRPNPSKTRPSKEKERLQNLMAFGKEFEEINQERKEEDVSLLQIDPSDLFNEILNEIKERRDFLEEMNQLGLGKKYLCEIQCQISVRLKELEKLDKERAEKIYVEYGI
ncbi:uncharacterized protein CEXT_283651 [Caerostris extrusa]|uniref:Uncharacterized protein n=1 Tax=Caerostris extrusa TaxID=172846 RepID=A0AAV4TUW7_CAEEX|nr:uncharacterized protein CEXT_283651 [Caerostris extrusa]